MIRSVTAAAVVLAAAAGIGVNILTAPAAGAPTRTAVPATSQTIGALFTVTPDGGLGTHFCTASVVDSPAGNLVLTAAHCMSSRSAGAVAFVPGYADGQMPFGIWMVTRVIVDQHWSSSSDPDDDFAFLVVSQSGTKGGVQQVTGGEAVGVNTPAGGTVQVAGYPDGGDSLVSCENTVLAFSPTQFQFDCGGFTNGTSGSPLLAASASGGPDTVIGVIGGHETGGDSPSVSYAARFGAGLSALYQEAVAESRS